MKRRASACCTFPGLQRPGLIEAMKLDPENCKRWYFRAFNGPVSLKRGLNLHGVHPHADFRAFNGPVSIEA